MMLNFKRLFNGVVVWVLVLLVFSACTGSPAPTESASTASASTASASVESTYSETTSAETTSAESKNTENSTQLENPSWKTDTSPMTIDWFASYDWYGKQFDPVKNMADKKILEETGITLNIITGDIDKFTALIATDSLPDVVSTDVTASQRKLMEDNGLCQPLDVLMEEYAPDLNTMKSMMDWYRNADGHWYSIISYYKGPERCNPEYGGYYATENGNFVRTDILQQIGMTIDDMKTKDGFLSALRKVKDMNITYDGQPVRSFTNPNIDFFAEQFGFVPEDKDGNLVNIMRSPEYLEALLYVNQMYTEGLITDEEFTSIDRNTLISSGGVFAVMGWSTVYYARQALFSADNNALLLYSGRVTDGKMPYLRSSGGLGWTATMITQKAKNPGRIMQFFSYMTSEEMTLDCAFGTGAWEFVNGKAEKVASVANEFSENYDLAYAKYFPDFEFLVGWDIVMRYQPDPDPSDILYVDERNYEKDPFMVIYDNKCFTDIKPDPDSELEELQTRINLYWEQAWPRIIMAPSSAECQRLFEEAIEEMDRMGWKRIGDYSNERFLANKARLGIEYAFPGNQK